MTAGVIALGYLAFRWSVPTRGDLLRISIAAILFIATYAVLLNTGEQTVPAGPASFIINTMPVFSAFFMLFAMANCGLPGTSGFVGEFLVTLGAMKVSFWYAALAATTLMLGAAYTLWMYRRVVFGAVANSGVASLKERLREAR